MDIRQTQEKLNRDARAKKLLDLSLEEIKNESALDEHNIDDIILSVDESWNDYKKKYEESKEIIYPGVRPIGQTIITTATLMNVLEQKRFLKTAKFDVNMLDELKKSVSDVQTVVAVGIICKEVKVGDLVKINLGDFFRIKNPNTVNAKEVFELPLEKINERDYISMHERNVKYIYESKKL